MTTFVLVHGSGDGGWAWHLVQRALEDAGHEAVAPDLPTDRDDVTWNTCVDVLVDAVHAARDVVVVGHSSGAFVAALAADRLRASLQVAVAGMVPRPGETAEEWFDAVGWGRAVAEAAERDGGLTGHHDPAVAFYHDVPAALAEQARAHERPTTDVLGRVPWPSATLPSVPARYVVTAADRFLPPAVQRRVAAGRLGVAVPDEVDAGHCVHLSRPQALADLLAGYVAARS